MDQNAINRAETRAMNKGLREGREEMKNAILKDIKEDISWIGDKRMEELGDYLNKKYEELTYGK